MGITALFCCFKDKGPVCPSVIGLISSIISFAFFLWTMVWDNFFPKDSEDVLLSIIFIITCVLIVLFIIVLVISILKRPTCGQAGKIISIIIFALSIICWILTLIYFIITLKDYANKEKHETGDFFTVSDWSVIIVPCIFAFLLLILVILCANYLYRAFFELSETPSFPVNQITESNNYPNIAQPGMLSNKAPGLPVNIQQSEANK